LKARSIAAILILGLRLDAAGAGTEPAAAESSAPEVNAGEAPAPAPDSTHCVSAADPPWSTASSEAALPATRPAATLAEALAFEIDVDVPAPRREGVRQVVALHGRHAAATAVYVDGIPLHPCAGPGFDLGLLPPGLVTELRLGERADLWHPSAPAHLELSIASPAPPQARTRLGALRGWSRELAGEEIDLRSAAGRFGSGGLFYQRRDLEQPVASIPTSGFVDLLATPSERAWALSYQPPLEGLEMRAIQLSLTASDRPAAFPESGERTTHLQSDQLDLIGATASLPEPGIWLSLSSQRSVSELTGLFGIGSFATLEEGHTGVAAAWTLPSGERHDLRLAWRLDDASGAASYTGSPGSRFARTLLSQWWLISDRIALGSGVCELFAGRLSMNLGDYRFAVREEAASLSGKAEIGGVEVRGPIGASWSAALGASAHARPLTYLEHLYLVSDLAFAERGLSARGMLRREGSRWQAEIGGGLTRWTQRARFAQGEEGAYDWRVELAEERQGDAYLELEGTLIGGLRGSGGWRLDGGDLPTSDLWRHHFSATLGWDWSARERPLMLGLLGAGSADRSEGRWSIGISAALRLAITEDFAARFLVRNLAFAGEIYGPQYGLELSWVLWG